MGQRGVEQTDRLSQARDVSLILCERPVWPTGILHLKKHLWHHCCTARGGRQARDSFTITGNPVVNSEWAMPQRALLYVLDRECKERSLVKFIWTAKGVGCLLQALTRSKVFSKISAKDLNSFGLC